MNRRDPTFGKTPGAEILAEGRKWKDCTCGESILVGQVKDVHGMRHWRVFDALPIEHRGLRYYTRHRCRKE